MEQSERAPKVYGAGSHGVVASKVLRIVQVSSTDVKVRPPAARLQT